MKKVLLSLFLAQFAFTFTFAQMAPGIHVDGNNLKDDAGNIVVLHGYMDTPSPYFNSNRWGVKEGWGYIDPNSSSNGATNIRQCISYFKSLFYATTLPEKGTYCNIFRLHLDPCWTNNSSVSRTGFTQKDGKTYDPQGVEVSGEADTHQFDKNRLTKYMRTLYTEIAKAAMGRGMHVSMRPPGVCPGDIYVDGDYQNYLLTVWDIVTKNDTVKKYYKHISIELANEPVRIHAANGQQTDQALRDFFQPVINKIRENGFKGIIWVPGTGWQSSYAAYTKYPVKDPLHNLGFAVHDYSGWYGTSDNSYNTTNAINNFGNQVPVVRTNPIVITEVDWSPKKAGTGHYNEHGEWVESNYGTWATGSTSKWGKAYKATLDYYQNISMTLSGTDCYLDWSSYLPKPNLNRYTEPDISRVTVKPAFTGVEEACGEACWKWYKEYAQVNYPSEERYQPYQEIPQNPLALEANYVNPHLLYENTFTKGNGYAIIEFKNDNGAVGWRFEEPLDVSAYKYLVVDLYRVTSRKINLRIYDTHDFWGDYAEVTLDASSSHNQIDLTTIKTVEGKDLDLTNIRLVYFTSVASKMYLAKTFFSNDGETDATAIATVSADKSHDNNKYDIVGRIINGTPKGFYIQNGKKFFNK